MSNCSCCGEKEKKRNLKLYLARLVVALGLGITFIIVEVPLYVKLAVYISAFLIAGFEVFWEAAKDIATGKFFDEHFLMSIASIAAFVMGEYFEAVTLMVFFGFGDLLQELAVKRSRSNIEQLMDIRPDYANLKKGDEVTKVHPSEVVVGDIIVVKPGEKVALDGEVVYGESFIDTKAITGESVPRRVKAGDSILSGTINNDSVIEIRVTKNFAESTVSKILELVQNASDKKSKSEKFITKFAKVYTPIVIALAVSVAFIPPLLGFGGLDVWIYRAISFLVISCPCALVVSIPVGVFGGIGGAAHNGILIKGGNYLDDLCKVTTVAFDKTGTLTKGVFEVVEINTEDGIRKDELLEFAAIAEQHSSHPIAKSIIAHYGKDVGINADATERSGFGIVAKSKCNARVGDTKLTNKEIYVGNQKLMAEIGINDLPIFPQTTVYVAVNKKYSGYILIADVFKDNLAQSLQAMSAQGITDRIMLTGDNEGVAKHVADELELSYRANLLPQDKVAEFEKIRDNARGKVVFVGDGINDAPVLKMSDIGIAMGGVGSDAAIEAADIVIMNDDIGKVATAKKIARKSRRIIMQNIVFSLGVKAAVMGFAFFGLASILAAIFADVGVALLAILNATRCLGKN